MLKDINKSQTTSSNFKTKRIALISKYKNLSKLSGNTDCSIERRIHTTTVTIRTTDLDVQKINDGRFFLNKFLNLSK